jgi:hypothetical protein
MGVARSWELMPADEKAFEEVLSLHLGLLGAYRGCHFAADSAGHRGVSDGAMQTTL